MVLMNCETTNKSIEHISLLPIIQFLLIFNKKAYTLIISKSKHQQHNYL